jgi:hypothetical protein
MSIVIPESVKSYCASHGVRTAINTLSEQSTSYMPDNLEWDELPSYYQSVLYPTNAGFRFPIANP